jgi:hypothetical protein
MFKMKFPHYLLLAAACTIHVGGSSAQQLPAPNDVAHQTAASLRLQQSRLSDQQMDTLTAGDALDATLLNPLPASLPVAPIININAVSGSSFNLSFPSIPSITSIFTTGGLSFTLPTGLLSTAPASSPTTNPASSPTPSPASSPTPSPAPSPTPSPASSIGYAR